jgi:hypothetical protein
LLIVCGAFEVAGDTFDIGMDTGAVVVTGALLGCVNTGALGCIGADAPGCVGIDGAGCAGIGVPA